MKTLLKTKFEKDPENRRIHIQRSFAAPVDRVWSAWTESDLLIQWFAPRPWRAESKAMDFRVGGHWLYCMVSPEGDRHWARIDYRAITPGESYEADDCFCDEDGVRNEEMPAMHWQVNFEPAGESTNVRITITFANLEAMNGIVEMGFEGGLSASHENLDELLAGN